MNRKGGFHLDRGLIALTGFFIAAASLSACGNEKMAELRTGGAALSDGQTEVALQKGKSHLAGETPVSPVSKQAVSEGMQLVQPDTFDKLSEQTEPIQFEEVLSASRLGTTTAPYTEQCGENNIVIPLREVVSTLEAKSLLYATQPLTDCSGVFHRVLLGLKQRCPGQEYPSVTTHRDSRALARWYHERGKLTLIENALLRTDLIKPGTVLFYGRTGFIYKDFTVADLLRPGLGINHLGVVVTVYHNESGEVLRYELFHGHGRRGKTAASITDWHKRGPTRIGYPPFGNGQQQLVAAARI